MNYAETEQFLYSQLPVFQRDGAAALKHKLDNILSLCDYLGNPQDSFKSIHVAGTNGKGSSSHYLSSILTEAGYKVGLYTSPHLKSFTERIKIDGKAIPESEVVDFVELIKPKFDIKPSFFEITVAMAFHYFAQSKVDIAIIEVGLGGRYDSTNIIKPEVSLITNISRDHEEFLGSELPKIAYEKAGIIKPKTPVVVSEYQSDEISQVFEDIAKENGASLTFASQTNLLADLDIDFAIPAYQAKNLNGVLHVVNVIQAQGWEVSTRDIEEGIKNLNKNSGLKGRWQTLQESPKVICDCGHNEAAFALLQSQLQKERYDQLWFVLGMVSDKDHDKIMSYLPQDAHYLFTSPSIPRKLDANKLQQIAAKHGLSGEVFSDVNEAITAAKEKASTDDLIFVGGSNFVVADIDGL